MIRFLSQALFVVIPLWLLGCASYSSRIQESRRLFESGDYEASISKLQELVQREDKDQLLYLMDLGTVYHVAGRYKEATETFLQADKLAEIKDYTSLGAEAASVLLSDQIKSYGGENFEKILINVYLAIDYTLAGQWEDALVECRRVNHKLDLMIREGGLPYEKNAFAKYLAALLFEARREFNDAFVDYRELHRWNSHLPYLSIPLLRMADRLGAEQELAQYKKEYGDVKGYRLSKGEGEIILLLETGNTPIKVPHPDFHLLPKFKARGFSYDYGWINVGPGRRVRSQTLFDIEATAIKDLDHKVAGIIAKKIAGVVAKQIVADQVAKQTKSEALGFLTAIALHATDSADLRSWTTLPARLQVARLDVPAGRHNVSLDMVHSTGTEVPGVKRWEAVEVKAGQKVFLHYRSVE